MIEKLTLEQKERFVEFVEKWTKIGLSTEPANRKEAEEGIVEMYAIAGFKKPKIVWCSSPLSQGITRRIVLNLEADGILHKKIGDSVRDSVRASVGDSVGASVWDSVGASVWDSVRASVGASVWDSVGANVGDSVRASVWANVRDSVGASGYGQHDASWLAFYNFFMEVCRLENETKKISGIWKVCKNAGWYLPHENICWISERHNVLNRDDRGRLHNNRGIALAYPDGWGIYALHGVRFSEELWKKVVSGNMPFADILKIENIDQRTQAMRYGNVDEFLEHVGTKNLDTYQKQNPNGDAVNYSLYEIPSGEVFRKIAYYVVYDCPSTGRKYMSGVEKCKKVEEAMAWKFQISPEQWKNMIPLVTES